jgi:hypothetical protein
MMEKLRGSPPPLAKVSEDWLQWTINQVVSLILVVIFAHSGMIIIMGVYYLVFEVYHPITVAWHNAVSDTYTRHAIRDVFEGFLGGFAAQLVIWNHYKNTRMFDQQPNSVDRIEQFLRIPNLRQKRPVSGWQLAMSPILALLYGTPIVVAILFIVNTFHLYLTSLGGIVAIRPHSSVLEAIWNYVHNWWTENFDKKLIGYAASLFFGRRPMRMVFDHVQRRLVARRLAAGSDLRFYHSPTYKARYNELKRTIGRRIV